MAHATAVARPVDGVPLYLEWWDQSETIRNNLLRLSCTPGGSLLTEGELVLATEAEEGDFARQVLYAVAAGRTKHNEIADAVRADPTRTLDRLVSLRLVERLSPVTEDPRRTRRRIYRIADNSMAFFLGVLDRYQAEIDRGLGEQILSPLFGDFERHMGGRWEEAFRMHLRQMAMEGQLGADIVALGPFWTAADDPHEIDAVVLAGRSREAVLMGEAKWARKVSETTIRRELERKSSALPRVREDLRFAVCAREQVERVRGPTCSHSRGHLRLAKNNYTTSPSSKHSQRYAISVLDCHAALSKTGAGVPDGSGREHLADVRAGFEVIWETHGCGGLDEGRRGM